jgi:hypothetical protein
MRSTFRNTCAAALLIATSLCAQVPESAKVSILTKDLPTASLWSPYGTEHQYGVRLRSEGGVAPYHWRILSGSLPRGLKLEEYGKLLGAPDESGRFDFALLLRDSSNPPAQVEQKLKLNVETPFSAEWDRKAQVNGQRIDGSVKVSNRTGRDFDLTFIVLAVNDIGRATAIGYQHFPLRKNTRDFSLPFGETLSSGNYTVNVDVVAEEPVSSQIFRARLVTGKESIAQGP